MKHFFHRSLLTISNSEILVDLSVYYRKFISQMCYRMLTPYDQSPYADELEKLLEQNPVVLPESDEEWEDTYVRGTVWKYFFFLLPFLSLRNNRNNKFINPSILFLILMNKRK